MLRNVFAVLLGLAVILVINSFSYAFRDSIVAAWTFDEGTGKDIHDVSGNGNDGELVGGAKWVDGKFGKALDFDGSTNYIEVPFDDSMKVLNQGDFTLAAWYKPDVIPKKHVVFQQGDSGGTGRTWLFTHQDAGEIRSYLGGNTTASGINAEAGEWYHTAVVVTEGGGVDSVQLYINGEIAGAPFAIAMEDSEGNYFIGCHKDIVDLMDGIIDDLVLIKKALSEAEVKDLMNNGVTVILSVEPKGKLAVNWGNIKDDTGF
jgi:hypothetical protein